MTVADVALIAFTACNMGRVLAYLPQVLCIARDREGARAISLATWSLFALAHLSTVAYALATVGDVAMALLFAANTLGCLVIVGLTAWKRARHAGLLRPRSRSRPILSVPIEPAAADRA